MPRESRCPRRDVDDVQGDVRAHHRSTTRADQDEGVAFLRDWLANRVVPPNRDVPLTTSRDGMPRPYNTSTPPIGILAASRLYGRGIAGQAGPRLAHKLQSHRQRSQPHAYRQCHALLAATAPGAAGHVSVRPRSGQFPLIPASRAATGEGVAFLRDWLRNRVAPSNRDVPLTTSRDGMPRLLAAAPAQGVGAPTSAHAAPCRAGSTALLLEQIVVVAALDDLAVLEHQDRVARCARSRAGGR